MKKLKNGVPSPRDMLSNGAVVLAVRPYERFFELATVPCRLWVVLCYWGEPDHVSPVTPYVTWVYSADDGSCVWGHYYGTPEKAYVDFATRGPVEAFWKEEK